MEHSSAIYCVRAPTVRRVIQRVNAVRRIHLDNLNVMSLASNDLLVSHFMLNWHRKFSVMQKKIVIIQPRIFCVFCQAVFHKESTGL